MTQERAVLAALRGCRIRRSVHDQDAERAPVRARRGAREAVEQRRIFAARGHDESALVLTNTNLECRMVPALTGQSLDS